MTSVLCLGEVLWDNIADQPTAEIAAVDSWTAYPGGAPANVASALVKLGISAGFIGCVGMDEAGDRLVAELEQAGVDIQAIQRHATAPTRIVQVLRSATGDRHFAGFKDYPTTAFADTYLQAEHLDRTQFEAAAVLVLGTIGLAYPATNAAIQHALTLADEYYLKVVLDVNWRSVFWPQPELAPGLIRSILPRVDVLKLASEEADWLFQTTDPGAIADQLETVEAVIVTHGDRGCGYALAGQTGVAPAFVVEVEDTTGAGDGFLAGFIYQLLRQGIASWSDPLQAQAIGRYANAVGALTTTRSGAIAAQPTAAEVDAFLYLQNLTQT